MRAVPEIAVILPTVASRDRAAFLHEALSSILQQEGVRAIPTVVVNGGAADPELVATLRRDSRMRVVSLSEADLPAALARGRDAVDTEFFSQLDDDDKFLPGALRVRLQALLADSSADAAVTRGLCRGAGVESETVASLDYARADPLTAILRDNWLYPGSALFRSETVDRSYFQDIPRHLEWTFFGTRLSLDRKVVFLNDVTFIYRTDNPESLSKRAEYTLERPHAFRKLLALDLPPAARRMVNRRLAAVHHDCSVIHLTESRLGMAWRSHLQCLRYIYGIRYIPYTRHLIGIPGRRRAKGFQP